MSAVLGARDLLDPEAVVGRLAVHLAREGHAGLPGALGLLVDTLDLRSAVLRQRGDSTDLIAVAGDVVQAVPLVRAPRAAILELPVCGPAGSDLATLTLTGVTPSALPVLRAAAAVLGLALAAQLPPVPNAGALLLDAEAAWSVLADAMHDGPVQDLIAARWAVDALGRGGDVSDVRAAVQRALVALRRDLWQMRARGDDGLGAALEALSERLVEAGAPALTLRIHPDADVLGAAPSVAAYRMVQVLGRGCDEHSSLTVALRRQDAPGGRQVVVLSVDGGPGLADAPRWRRTAASLGGYLLCRAGSLSLAFPVPSPVPTPPSVIGIAPTAKALL